MNRKIKVFDLFSGAGGMSEGFLQAGFHVQCATDYSKEASLTYTNRHKQLGYNVNFHCGDIRELFYKKKLLDELLDNKDIDVVVGGPPCQGFSLTGKREKNDARNELFLEYLKAVQYIKPKYFVMENVEGLLSYKFEEIKGLDGEIYTNVFPQNVILNEAWKLGYFVKFEMLNSKDYGVPQNRERVIFLGHKICNFRGGKYRNTVVPPEFPKQQKNLVSVEDAISDLKFLKNGEIRTAYDNRFGNKSDYQLNLRNGLTPSAFGYPIKTDILYNHQASKHLEKTVNRFKLLNSGESVTQLLSRLTDDLRLEVLTKKYRCQKLDKNNVSPTVLTLPDDIIHYDKSNPRILSVRELARIQSFDDSFQFFGKRTTGGVRRKYETPQYTQVGNAVPPLFARAIADEIKKAILKTENQIKGDSNVQSGIEV
ncbi:DNA cytosine methyltransferase [Bacillus altitudinis]|uniref:DNA cytosine methyltransferase n=1 Tax=Bacillus altitudinis TaxID=293387 RepID=UPI00148ED279|nr:DNA cytosine methyltransferase [Bacillus altitudinis]NOL31114.1 DNA cytosine methyltransferase [Bacillus altitudinis]